MAAPSPFQASSQETFSARPTDKSMQADTLDLRLPAGAWDSHVHVIDEDRFSLHPDHPFRPKKATLSDLQAFHRELGVENICLIAFSVYKTDNRSLLDALTTLKGRGRAVACIDPWSVTDEELQILHDAGVRGVRVNLKTTSDSVDESTLRETAKRVRPYAWAVQLFVSLWQVQELFAIIPSLGVPIVIDHIGSPDPAKGPGRQQRGYRELINLLQTGQVWTKLSGVYRFPTLPDLDEYVTEILRVAPDRVVWATDWPHSGGVEMNPGGDRTKIQDYRKVDDKAWVLQCKTWCRDVGNGDGSGVASKIWVDNPSKLWQLDSAS